MKKLLSLVVFAAAIGLTVGCNDSKTTGGTGTKITSGAVPSTGSVTKTP